MVISFRKVGASHDEKSHAENQCPGPDRTFPNALGGESVPAGRVWTFDPFART